ncbi:unnamed protein product [Chrysoparadoxa australica]
MLSPWKLIYLLGGALAYVGMSSLLKVEPSENLPLQTVPGLLEKKDCHPCPHCPKAVESPPCPTCPRPVVPKQAACPECVCPKHELCPPNESKKGSGIPMCQAVVVTAGSRNGEEPYAQKRRDLAETLVKEGGPGGVRIAIGAIFNNEMHVLHEWLLHYMLEGVSFFSLIAHQSSPMEKAYVEDLLAPYMEAGLVELRFVDHHELYQTEMYKQIIYPGIESRAPPVDWMMFVDMDEFVYGAGQYDSLGDLFHAQKGNRIGTVCSGFEFFGSNDLFFQPRCIVPSMTRRGELKPNKGKCAFRPEAQAFRPEGENNISLHWIPLKEGWERMGREMKENAKMHDMDENDVDTYPLRVAHYRVQSFEYHSNVREKRGGLNYIAARDKKKRPKKDGRGGLKADMGYNFISDLTLARRRHWHGWGLGCGPDSWESLFADWAEERPYANTDAFGWGYGGTSDSPDSSINDQGAR